ncbi:hypothetical protein Trydic_g17317 [Trypoxylus dichotomus]
MLGTKEMRKRTSREETEEELETIAERDTIRKSTGASALEEGSIDLVMRELAKIKEHMNREVNGKLSFTRSNQQTIRDCCDMVAAQLVQVLKESRKIEREKSWQD